ncbi:tandem-95 repeat protein [Candidatus Pacearchaeota archaeon]|nr:tandem-95 repeat protein [Candidatus Pacearchaeota archaeon]
MRNLFFVLVIALLVIPLASAADFAYILKSSVGVDSGLVDEIESLGYSTEVIYETELANVDLSEYRIVIVGDQNLVSPENVSIQDYRTLVLSSFNFYQSASDWQLGLSKERGIKTSPTSLEVTDLSHPIVNSLPLSFKAYTQADQNVQTYYLKGQKPSGIKIVVSSGSSADAVIATLDKGKHLLNGETVQERIAYYGIVEQGYWTPQSKKLFENTINWLLVGEDRDEDSFFSDVDCNDLDDSAYPGAIEIPYDSIDQDCDGSDLTDLDEDGFDSSEINGPDCDDYDPLINPDSNDPELNCINDAPNVVSISLESVYHETNFIEIGIIAEDYENDNLNYSINDSRFEVNDNVISWQTDYEDGGQYIFRIDVSDGQLTSSRTVSFRINQLNRPPVLSEIPQVSWDEDSSFILNLSQYFQDEDQDSLVFGIQSTSTEENIIISSFENGLINFTSVPDFFGSDWIVFFAFDGKEVAESDIVNLTVNPVNDIPLFIQLIENITWDEDSSLSEAIDLNDYFIDIDSDLEFNVSGNENIIVEINDNGQVSFSSIKDYAGQEIITFSATDGEFTTYSNSILLEVLEAGEPPVFQDLDCQTNIDEDEIYSCILEATDFENDTVTFSIVSQSNAICEIENNTLTYKSASNYNGLANCNIKVFDVHGQDTKLLNLTVSPINDAPEITSFSPEDSVINVPEGFTKKFSVSVTDLETSSLNISWILSQGSNQEVVASTREYIFSANPGSYNLKVIVSDLNISLEKNWTVIVGSISQFTCAEVSGSICTENQVCRNSILGVKDTDMCCSSSCVPAFRDADSCEILNSTLRVDISEPSSSKEFIIGDTIRTLIDLDNNGNEEQNLDVELHLYDLDEDESVAQVNTETELLGNRERTIVLNLVVPEDIDLDHSFALYAKVEDEVCNEDYLELTNLEREDYSIVVSNFAVQIEAQCGDIIQAKVKVENTGSKDKDISINVKSSELKIDEKSETFKLEKHGEEDQETRTLLLEIPSNAKQGDYNLESFVTYNSEKASLSKTIRVNCESNTDISTEAENVSESSSVSGEESIKLNSVTKGINQNEDKKLNPVLMLIVTLMTTILLAGFAVVLYQAASRN